MKKTIILAAVAACCLLASCSKELSEGGASSDLSNATWFNASQFELKTVIGAPDEGGAYQPLFTEKDSICVNGVKSTKAVLNDGGKTAAFAVSGVSAPYCAITAPNLYVDGLSTFDSDTKTMKIIVSGTESPQKYSLNGEYLTYSPGSDLMAAYSESSTNLNFHHLMAYLKITINGGDNNIKTLYLRQAGDSPEIAGFWNIVFKGDNDFEFTPGTLTSYLTLNCGADGVASGSSVMMAVPAYKFKDGLILTVKDVKGNFQSYSIPAASSNFSEKAGKIITKTLSFAPQSGTINTADDYNAFVAAVNSGNDYDLYRWVGDGTVKIGADFTVDNPTYVEKAFSYNVDGQGHTLTIANGTHALFRNVHGTISNLTVAGEITSSTGKIAAIADSLYPGGLIKDCVNKASITSTGAKEMFGGGLVRVIYQGGSIEGCTNEGNITVSPDCSAAYLNCHIGGIVGQINNTKEDVTIKDCANSGAIYVDPTTTAKFNLDYAGYGGIVGWIRSAAHNVTLDNCDNSGKITISADHVALEPSVVTAICVGGIVGIGAPYYTGFHLLSSPSENNGMDITLKNCDNTGEIYNCGINGVSSNKNLNGRVFSGGIAGALLGKKAKYVSVDNCTVNSTIIPYDIVSGSKYAAFCAMTGGMVGFGGYVDVNNSTIKTTIGNGKRQAVSIAGLIGCTMKPFKLRNSKLHLDGWFNRCSGYKDNRACVAVVPVKYSGNAIASPVPDVNGSEITDSQIGWWLRTSNSAYPNTNTADLSSYCTSSLTNTVDAKKNCVIGQGFTENTGVTFTNVTYWDGK